MGNRKKGIGYLVSFLVAAAFIIGASQAAWSSTLTAATKTVAVEALDATTATPDNSTVIFTPSAPLIAGNSFKLELTNGSFDNVSFSTSKDEYSVLITDNTTGNGGYGALCYADPTYNDKSVLDCTVASGETLEANKSYYIVDNTSISATPAATNVTIDINSTLNAGDTVTLAATSDSAPGGIADAVTLFKIEQQYSATIKAAEDKIDFASAQKEFYNKDGDYTESDAKICLKDNPKIDERISDTLGVNGKGGALEDVSFSFDVKGNFEGVATVNGVTVSSTEKAKGEVKRTASTVNAINGNLVTICPWDNSSAINTLPITVDGQTVLTPRQFKTTLTLVPSASDTGKFRKETLLNEVVSHIWTLNATTYYVPLIKTDPTSGVETYIKLQAKEGAGEGAYGVSVDILGSDGKTVTYDAGTITPGKPLTITGAQLAKAAENAGDKVDGVMGFAATIKVNAPQGDLFTYANIMDPTGAKRVPVKVVTNAGDILE